MPVKHQTTFDNNEKCSESYYIRLRRPTCSLGERPFLPLKTEKDPFSNEGAEQPIKQTSATDLLMNRPFLPTNTEKD